MLGFRFLVGFPRMGRWGNNFSHTCAPFGGERACAGMHDDRSWMIREPASTRASPWKAVFGGKRSTVLITGSSADNLHPWLNDSCLESQIGGKFEKQPGVSASNTYTSLGDWAAASSHLLLGYLAAASSHLLLGDWAAAFTPLVCFGVVVIVLVVGLWLFWGFWGVGARFLLYFPCQLFSRQFL